MSTFNLPDLGEGLQDAQIVAWHVAVGDHVVADQPLVSVETQKAVVDIPSPLSGRVARLYGEPGDVIEVGAALVDYEQADTPGSESVVGELPHDDSGRLQTTGGDAPADVIPTGPQVTPNARADSTVAEVVRAAPAVRRMARAAAVDLASITGTGPDGLITADDVRRAQVIRPSAGSAGEALTGTRRAMADIMARAGSQIVPATVTADADVSGWYDKDAHEHEDPTIRLVQAVVAGCLAEPALNTWFDVAAQQRTVHSIVDLGVAMDTAQGLFVPVLRNAQALSPQQIRSAVDSLKEQVLSRTISMSQLSGQTCTLSNFGTLIGRYANLVIVPPQVAILGAGQITDQVVAIDSVPTVRKLLPLSLTFDHRVVTGGEAARFLRAATDSLQRPDNDGAKK